MNPQTLPTSIRVPLTLGIGGHEDADDAPLPQGRGAVAESGLFWPSPDASALMCRLRMPGGALTVRQWRQIAALSKELTTGDLQITTRGNLQLRRIAPQDTPAMLDRLRTFGIHALGDDHLRNLSASPMAGLDPQELADVRPVLERMRRTLAAGPEFRDLPRKLNLAFDGGGAVPCLDAGNDISAFAVEVLASGPGVSPGIWYRLALGGLHAGAGESGGLLPLVHSRDLVAVCASVLRLLLAQMRRSGTPLRVKSLVDQMGHAALADKAAKKAGVLLAYLPENIACLAPRPARPAWHAPMGLIPQKEPGQVAIGVALPGGRMTAAQLEAVADLADRFGSGEIRATHWQNLLVPDVDEHNFPAFAQALRKTDLETEATHGQGGGVTACTGNKYCPHALSDTQGDAAATATRLPESAKSSIHVRFSGCARACARHLTGDIGLVATGLGNQDESFYDLTLGGGSGIHHAAPRKVFTGVPAAAVPELLGRMTDFYLKRKLDEESVPLFFARYRAQEIRAQFGQ